jgi:endonuclease/exonuclease/phosphatase family metal-dependent hydrolase
MSLIRVVSYNIHKGRSALGRRDSLNELRLGLYGLRPDLVFLQEVQGRNEQKSLLDAQHESLAAALRLDVAYGRNAIRHETDHGIGWSSADCCTRASNSTGARCIASSCTWACSPAAAAARSWR